METIHGLHDKLVKGEISAVELTNAFLAHKDAVEPKVQAFLSDNRQFALEAAAAVDNICIQGQKATCASKMLQNFTSPYNATVIEKLTAADYVSLGKTNMDEFAMGSSTENSAFQITHNPWNLDYVPGGSSGGSASAVASGECLVPIQADPFGNLPHTAVLSASNRHMAWYPAMV